MRRYQGEENLCASKMYHAESALLRPRAHSKNWQNIWLGAEGEEPCGAGDKSDRMHALLASISDVNCK